MDKGAGKIERVSNRMSAASSNKGIGWKRDERSRNGFMESNRGV